MITNPIQSFNRLALTGYSLHKLEVKSENSLRIDLSGITAISPSKHILQDCTIIFGEITAAKIRLRRADHPMLRSIKCQRGGASSGSKRQSGARKPYLFRLQFDVGHIDVSAPTYAYCVTRSLPFTDEDERTFARSKRVNGNRG